MNHRSTALVRHRRIIGQSSFSRQSPIDESGNAGPTIGCIEKNCTNGAAWGGTGCGTGATCSDGSVGDGYRCTCDPGWFGTATSNMPAGAASRACARGRVYVGGLRARACVCVSVTRVTMFFVW